MRKELDVIHLHGMRYNHAESMGNPSRMQMEMNRKPIGIHMVSLGKQMQSLLNPLKSICNLWGIYSTPYEIHEELIRTQM